MNIYIYICIYIYIYICTVPKRKTEHKLRSKYKQSHINTQTKSIILWAVLSLLCPSKAYWIKICFKFSTLGNLKTKITYKFWHVIIEWKNLLRKVNPSFSANSSSMNKPKVNTQYSYQLTVKATKTLFPNLFTKTKQENSNRDIKILLAEESIISPQGVGNLLFIWVFIPCWGILYSKVGQMNTSLEWREPVYPYRQYLVLLRGPQAS